MIDCRKVKILSNPINLPWLCGSDRTYNNDRADHETPYSRQNPFGFAKYLSKSVSSIASTCLFMT